jgi:hypothetical protein
MAADLVKLLRFCRAVQQASDNGVLALDRGSLLAVHEALTVLKDEIEQALLRIPLDGHAMN